MVLDDERAVNMPRPALAAVAKRDGLSGSGSDDPVPRLRLRLDQPCSSFLRLLLANDLRTFSNLHQHIVV